MQTSEVTFLVRLCPTLLSATQWFETKLYYIFYLYKLTSVGIYIIQCCLLLTYTIMPVFRTYSTVATVLYCTRKADNFSEQGQKTNAGIAGFFKSSLGAGFSLAKKSGYKMRS